MTLDLNLVSLEIWPQFRAGRSPEPAAFGVKVVLVEASTNLVTDTPPTPIMDVDVLREEANDLFVFVCFVLLIIFSVSFFSLSLYIMAYLWKNKDINMWGCGSVI